MREYLTLSPNMICVLPLQEHVNINQQKASKIQWGNLQKQALLDCQPHSTLAWLWLLMNVITNVAYLYDFPVTWLTI